MVNATSIFGWNDLKLQVIVLKSKTYKLPNVKQLKYSTYKIYDSSF